jgi:hypothetical protein
LTQEGQLLIASDGEGLHLYDYVDSASSSQHIQKDLKYVNDMCLYEGSYFFATDRGIWKSKELLKSSPTQLEVTQGICNLLEIGKDHSLIYATLEGSIFKYNIKRDSNTLIAKVGRNRIRDLMCVGADLYVATDKGLFMQHARSMEARELKQIHDRPSQSLYLDDEGNLWSAEEGTIEVANMYFFKWHKEQRSEIHAMTILDDKLILGTDSGLVEFDRESGRYEYLKDNVNITSLDKLGGTLIAGTYDSGLIIFKNGKEQVLTNKEGLSDNTFLDVHLRNPKELIVSTLGGAQRWVKSSGHWVMVEHFAELSSNYILTILSDDEDLWFGTDNNGAFLLKNENIQQFEATVNGTAIGSIPSITHGKDGSIWMLSVKAGLLRHSDAGLQLVECPHGKWGKYSSLVALPSGMLFLIGERDVVMYDPEAKELLEFQEELALKSGESFFNNYALSGSDLVFEHNSSLYELHDIHSELRTHTLTSIVRVEVDLEPIDTSRTLFSEKESNFAFHFRGLLYRNSELVNYRYRLLGYEDEWRQSRDREARYYHLPVGEYTFQVRSSHDVISDDSDPVSYSFEVQPLLYNRLWFRGLILAALLLLLWWWFQRRKANRTMADRMERLSTETQLLTLKGQLDPHFLFNSFNTVIGLIEEDPERSISYVEHLTDFYRKVLEVGQEELIPMSTEFDLLKIYLKLLDERFGDAINVNIDQDLGTGLIPPMALQLLVENAVKHNICTDKQPLNVWIENKGEYISVRNDLRPKNGRDHSFGLGLKNLKERYRLLMDKEVTIDVSTDVFEVRLPRPEKQV